MVAPARTPTRGAQLRRNALDETHLGQQVECPAQVRQVSQLDIRVTDLVQRDQSLRRGNSLDERVLERLGREVLLRFV